MADNPSEALAKEGIMGTTALAVGLHAVVAKNKKCVLVTADENFVRKTKFKHVKVLGE